MVRSVNVKKTKKFKENCPEHYHVPDRNNLLAVSNRDWIAQADAHSTLGAEE